jgi:hypothetical protein
MANPTEEQIENPTAIDEVASDNTNVQHDQLPAEGSEADPIVMDRAQEIPALLESVPPHPEQPEELPELESASEGPDVDPPAREAEEPPEAVVTAPELASVQPEELEQRSGQYMESPDTPQKLSAIRSDLQSVLGSVQAFQENAEQISSKLDAVSSETTNLAGKVNEISLNHEIMSAELESLVSGSGSKNVLSKSFLIIASTSLFLLVVFQIYMFISLINVEKLQSASGPAIMASFSGLNKKLTEYSANLPKVPAPNAPDPHGQPQPAAHGAESGHESPAPQHTAEAPASTPLSEKLNRLRNGQAEKKLIRKETGDWFVYSKKAEECIADVEIIDALNQSYKKLGRPLATKAPVPSHNSLCILKPNGKGGTEIVMTDNFVP